MKIAPTLQRWGTRYGLYASLCLALCPAAYAADTTKTAASVSPGAQQTAVAISPDKFMRRS